MEVELLEDHEGAFLDFGKLGQSIIETICITLKEMIGEYGVRPRAIAVGNEKNFLLYLQKCSFSNNEQTRNDIDGLIYEFRKQSNLARVYERGIFFCEFFWKGNADGLRAKLEKFYEDGELKYKSLPGALVHEYSHLLYNCCMEASYKTRMEFIDDVLNEILLPSNRNQTGFIERINEIVGTLAPRFIEYFVNETWADLMACYYEDTKGGEPRTLDENTTSFVSRMLDKYFRVKH